ncbi:hypothetical protein [Arthrobacter sp. LjRoot14]|uniref:hypothetical protein n=1 Tax=Arthrobacter sp. LjRoot14 TaxID=3342265 RepID=UPI003ECE8169
MGRPALEELGDIDAVCGDIVRPWHTRTKVTSYRVTVEAPSFAATESTASNLVMPLLSLIGFRSRHRLVSGW